MIMIITICWVIFHFVSCLIPSTACSSPAHSPPQPETIYFFSIEF